MRAHYEKLSKDELIDLVLHYRGKFMVEKLESEWLDELADALRDGEDEPSRPTEEIKNVREEFNKKIINKTWKL